MQCLDAFSFAYHNFKFFEDQKILLEFKKRENEEVCQNLVSHVMGDMLWTKWSSCRQETESKDFKNYMPNFFLDP